MCLPPHLHRASPSLCGLPVGGLCVQARPPPLPRGVALDALVPLPALQTPCGFGFGLAACPVLGLLVTSDAGKNTLSVWGLPGGASGGRGGASGRAGASAGAGAGDALAAMAGGGGGLRLVCTLGGAGSPAPMQFQFAEIIFSSGFLAFTASSSSSSSTRPLLLVTDHGHYAVHLVDVVDRSHAGYLAPPGSIAGPRGVAASGTSPLVAVSTWKEVESGNHVVVVYRGSGSEWEAVRVIGDGQLDVPLGLRFSGDGSTMCVADSRNNRASVFRVGDGGLVRHMATGLRGPYDVEEVEGGWLVACAGSDTVEYVCDGDGGDGGGRPSLGWYGCRDGEFWYPATVAVVPGLGLVVRESGNERLQVFATPDTIAMAAMSPHRVAWMTVVARAILRRSADAFC